jgi:moderate conductance mechanosensitive channel
MTVAPTPSPSSNPPTPIIDPPVTAEAIENDVRHFTSQVSALSAEQIAVNAAWTIGIIVAALALLFLLRRALCLAARWMSPRREKHDKTAKRARRQMGGGTMIAARFVIGVLALGAVLATWGFDVRGGALGQTLGMFWRAGFIVMFAVAAIEVFGFVITRSLHRGARHAHDLRRAAQLRTLAPVLKGAATIFVGFLATMMTLSEFGVEIGPLIAGAGILGLAIGFGAQSLVKDFLTGIFLIIEDLVSVGDVVTIGEFGGVVENMSLRTIKLRDFDGTLHMFPYSEAMVIHNQTKGFSYAVFNLSISYSADIGQAITLMGEVGRELNADAAFSPLVRDDIEVVGVDNLATNAVILKGRIKTAPGQQWTVQREYLKRIKMAFDRNHIEIPLPQLRLVQTEVTQKDNAHLPAAE